MKKVIVDNNLIGLLSKSAENTERFFNNFGLVVPFQLWFEIVQNNKAINTIKMFNKYNDKIYFLDENIKILSKNLYYDNMKIKNFSKKFIDISSKYSPKNYINIYLNDEKKQIIAKKVLASQNQELFYKKIKEITTKNLKISKVTSSIMFATLSDAKSRLEAYQLFQLEQVNSIANAPIKKIQKDKHGYKFWHYYCNAHYFAALANILNQKEQKETGLYPFRNKKNFLNDVEILVGLCFADILVSEDEDCRLCAEYLLVDIQEKKIILSSLEELFRIG